MRATTWRREGNPLVDTVLEDILILLIATLAVVIGLRRLRLPLIVAFLLVGMLVGPYVLGWVAPTETTRALADFGVVFLLFTLGLDFSLPRLLAMRGEVLWLGSLQVGLTTAAVAAIAWALGIALPVAIVLGGAVSMTSTPVLLRQLMEQDELNRTHGRLGFGTSLFQDIAFALFFALAAALSAPEEEFSTVGVALAVGKAALALVVVLAAGRWLLRPMFHEIASSRAPELFTFAVLFVAVGSGWAMHSAGLSFALGAFLGGMMLAETEYRYQIEAGIRSFRDTLLGLFFVTIGMQLDLPALVRHLPTVLAMLAGMLVLKAAIVMLAGRYFAGDWFKALRTGIVIAHGGEFGFALLAVMLDNRLVAPGLTQSLLAAITLSMLASPYLIRHNKAIARFLLREKRAPAPTSIARVDAALRAAAQREHVMLCGYGRVGQNVARVLEGEGFEYLAVDLDPKRVRAATAAGDPVLYGDATDEGVLQSAGINRAIAVVVTYSDAGRAHATVQAVRRLRADLPILVRSMDDSNLEALLKAGATEVVPETLEAALTLVGNTLHMLQVPPSRVMRRLGDIRRERYTALRSVYGRDPAGSVEDTGRFREELHMVLLPPGAWAIGRSIREVRERGAEVSFTAVRRDGIVGRDPDPQMKLREGDVVVLFGTPEAQEHAEAVLLAG
ncbi:MAG TPA: cation:proton antiporter [Steroidobacteraceae bacterium]|nr:cation:proton antiporter [Steroidobacteraceae bacterium]